MLSKEEFENLTNSLLEKLDDTTKALVSEEKISLLSAYQNTFDELENIKKENETIKNEKEELLKVNGKLIQKIGFDKPVEEEKEENNNEEEEISISEVINEKGDMI